MRGTSRRWTAASVSLALGALVVAALGTTAAATALQGEDTSPEGLIDRLAALQAELPVLPPDDVIIIVEETWAEFPGDFTGARFELDALSDRARELFIDADDVEGPEAAAVSDAARAILVAHEGYDLLAAWEEHDLAFPLDAFDDLEVASGADETYGLAAMGLRLILDANARALPAYEILRDTELADAAEQQVFALAYDATRDFEAVTRPLIHRALALSTTHVLRPIDRFETTVPGVEARARTMRVVCIPREAYLDPAFTLEIPETLAALNDVVALDCPALLNDNEVRLVGQ